MANSANFKEFPASRQVSSVIYNGQDIIVVFKNGTIYQYNKVPKKLWDGLIAAESAGKYLNSEIKGTYTFEQIV